MTHIKRGLCLLVAGQLACARTHPATESTACRPHTPSRLFRLVPADEAGTLSVAVIDAYSDGLIGHSAARMRPIEFDSWLTAEAGRPPGNLEFSRLPPGRYILVVRAIGYYQRVDTLKVPHSGAKVVAALDVMPAGDCGAMDISIHRRAA
jgi:hypothetical protein